LSLGGNLRRLSSRRSALVSQPTQPYVIRRHAPINQIAKLASVPAKAGVNTFCFPSRKPLPFNLRGLPHVLLDDVTKHLQKFVGTLSVGNPGQS
jgi:hypothetical protein